jgi:hypothetical protein
MDLARLADRPLDVLIESCKIAERERLAVLVLQTSHKKLQERAKRLLFEESYIVGNFFCLSFPLVST